MAAALSEEDEISSTEVWVVTALVTLESVELEATTVELPLGAEAVAELEAVAVEFFALQPRAPRLVIFLNLGFSASAGGWV